MTILNTAIEFLTVVIFVILAYWHRDRATYAVAGFAIMIYGFSYWDNSWTLAILLVLLGFLCLLKAIAGKGRAE